ncbi:MAG: phosphonate ABC transporter ATP-binding protein [Leptolyngbya sp. SIO3F4]|nr:phosphonate ABC transporter ATP-binding protein [Leptolyngbya sp. SIO3F4]
MDPILETRQLVLEYAGGNRALDGVSIRVQEGEFVAIVGPSGAGKSTLLRVLNRLLTPTQGDVLVEGDRVTAVSGRSLRRVRRRVGMVFQQFNLVPQLTVLENVLVGWIGGAPIHRQIPALFRHFPTDIQRRALECLEQVHIQGHAHARAADLSGGQQQRVAIARVLMQNPIAILADEPIASLDPGSAEIVMDTLREINAAKGVPIVVNLHQVDVARAYSTRLIGLRAGTVLFDGAPAEVDDAMMGRLYSQVEFPSRGEALTKSKASERRSNEGVLV